MLPHHQWKPAPASAEALRARDQIKSAIRFLRGGRDDELHLIEASLAWEMGALHAMEWMLGLEGGEWFERHLAGLKAIESGIGGGVIHMADKAVRFKIDECAECGQMIEGQVVQICMKCLGRREHRVMQEREREAWAEAPPKDLALSADSKKAGNTFHLVLAVDRNYTYCGQRPAQPVKHRRRVTLSDLPEKLCPDCRHALEHIRMTAA